MQTLIRQNIKSSALLLLFVSFHSWSQTTWNGNVSTNWQNNNNWSDGIPNSTNHVIIPNVANSPEIVSASASAKSIEIQVGASLTIQTGETLFVKAPDFDSRVLNEGTLTNKGILQIGDISSTGNETLRNKGILNNNANAQIIINSSIGGALLANRGGTVNNFSFLELGNLGVANGNGIFNTQGGTINNNAGGTIIIDNSSNAGISNFASFNNYSLIEIGKNSNIGGLGFGLHAGIFYNYSGGEIFINNCNESGIYTSQSGWLRNYSHISIGNLGQIVGSGIINQSDVTNFSPGEIYIDNTGSNGGIFNYSTFNNHSVIFIGSNFNVEITGIRNEGAFGNEIGGSIYIDKIINGPSSSTSGIEVVSSNFDNMGIVEIGENIVSNELIGTNGGGNFVNSINGILRGTGKIYSPQYNNSGGTLSPGYSPGKMTFTGNESFSNCILDIEINGKGVPGINYDQIEVIGTATLGGTLNLSINYSGNIGDTIFLLTTSSITDTFDIINGLQANWSIHYTPTDVLLIFGVVLPVEYSVFRAFNNNEDGNPEIQLHWETVTEINNKGFYIERSSDAEIWDSIGFVKGQGNSTLLNSYSFIDDEPLIGINYYRLKQLDFDGSYKLSHIVSVNSEKIRNDQKLSIFPNPTSNGILNIQVKNSFVEAINVKLLNVLGKVVFRKTIDLQGDNVGIFSIDNLDSGNYFLEVVSDQIHFIEKVVIRK